MNKAILKKIKKEPFYRFQGYCKTHYRGTSVMVTKVALIFFKEDVEIPEDETASCIPVIDTIEKKMRYRTTLKWETFSLKDIDATLKALNQYSQEKVTGKVIPYNFPLVFREARLGAVKCRDGYEYSLNAQVLYDIAKLIKADKNTEVKVIEMVGENIGIPAYIIESDEATAYILPTRVENSMAENNAEIPMLVRKMLGL